MANNKQSESVKNNGEEGTTANTNNNHSSLAPINSEASENTTTNKDEEHQEEETRGHWSKGIEFFLSLVGYAIGIGNIWRFPYMCIKNGGGAFLIPFFLFLFICGMPLFLLELILGQFSNLSPITLWNICPLFRGIGLGMVVVSGIVCVYFNVIMAWSFYYLCMSFWPKLPWAGCDNSWNTPKCMDSFSAHAALMASQFENSSLNLTTNENKLVNATYSPSEEFWRNFILGQTDSPDDVGSINWPLLGCLVLAWVSVFLCMFKGVQTSGKVVYVTAVAPYIFLTILIIRGVTLPGAVDGLIFFLKPDFAQLLKYQVWIDACLQIFFSLGPAWGGLITMASFNKFNYNCYRDAFLVSIIDAGTCFLGGLVIFSVLGNMAYNTGSKVADFNRAGPGLAFVVYPAALNHLPLPQVWAVLFFAMLLTLGIDTQFGMFETVVSGVLDQFKGLHKHKTLVIAGLAAFEFLLGVPFVTGAGYYYFQVVDHYAAALSVTLMALLECVVVGYIYGVNRLYGDMELMFNKRPSSAWKAFWLFITPFLLFIIVISGLFQLSEPEYSVVVQNGTTAYPEVITVDNETIVVYNDYPLYVQETFFYPRWLIAMGWLCALSSLVVIPLLGIIGVARAKGTFMERIRKLCRPTNLWAPSPAEMKAEYLAKYRHKPRPIVEMRDKATSTGEVDGLLRRRGPVSIETTPPPYNVGKINVLTNSPDGNISPRPAVPSSIIPANQVISNNESFNRGTYTANIIISDEHNGNNPNSTFYV